MIKYLSLLLMFGLLGCSSEPKFPDPIKPTENKTETIKKWIDYFEPHLMVHSCCDRINEPKNKNICFLNPDDFPESTVAVIGIGDIEKEKRVKNKLFL